MAPSGRTITSSRTNRTTTIRRISRHPRRTNFKKKQQNNRVNKKEEEKITKNNDVPLKDSSSSKEAEIVEVAKVINYDYDDKVSINNNNNNSVCSTPKGQRFRIPEISTCPPAPKKKRMVSSNCSLRRSQLSFFSHPDLELFFFMALRDVSV